MNTSPDQAAPGEPFGFAAAPGAWLAGKWELIPKLGPAEGWWFPFWWEGPGTRCWRNGGPQASGARATCPDCR